jgi:hypothetical protein
MNYLKTINLSKQFGQIRIWTLSSITALLTFIIFYVSATHIWKPSLNDQYFYFLLIGLWLLYPFHTILHLLPLIPIYHKVNKSISFKYYVFPMIELKIVKPISKWLFLLSLLTPFIVINTLLVTACYFFNSYVHYFIILLSYHVGLCVSDFIWTKYVLYAPYSAYIEESDYGFEILINPPK